MQQLFFDSQPVLNRLLQRINDGQDSAQAYLLVGKTDKILKKYSVILTKALACPNKYQQSCTLCNICKRIDDGNYGELKIITAQNGMIKKDAVIDLRSQFQTSSIEGKKRIYIIENVECLNVSAANSILKFLEEPDTDLVAIFTTTNLDAVIPTIVSRCQVIKIHDEKQDKIQYIKDLTNLSDEKIQYIIDVFYDVETNINSVICSLNTNLLNEFSNRQELKEALNVLVLIYKDALNYLTSKELHYFSFEEKTLKLIDDMNQWEIVQKMSFILKNLAKLDYNVNMLLYMDNLLIGIGEIADGKSNRS